MHKNHDISRTKLRSWCENNIEQLDIDNTIEQNIMLLYKHIANFSLSTDDKQVKAYRLAEMLESIKTLTALNDIHPGALDLATTDGNEYLNHRDELQRRNWAGEPVIVCDLDDVLAKFRDDFAGWANRKYKIDLDPQSTEYYFIESMIKNDLHPQKIYEEFVNSRGLATLTVDPVIDIINAYHDAGVWIYIVTARPDNLISRLDTHKWLRDNNIRFNDIAFAGDKLACIAATEYYQQNKIAFAIDDGPNHVNAYVLNGIKCCMPIKTYNRNIFHPNMFEYHDADTLKNIIQNVFKLV